MFEVDKKVMVGNEFSAHIIFSELRIELERLRLIWKSSNGERNLIGARIEDIDPVNKLCWKKICQESVNAVGN